MSDALSDALKAVIERTIALAASDEHLRTGLQRLAEAYLEAVRPAAGPSETEPVRVELPAEAAAELALEPGPAAVHESQSAGAQAGMGPAVPLTLGQGSPAEASEPGWPSRWLPTTDDDLQAIEIRCRLKAEGARWAAERQRRIGTGADYRTDIEPRDREIVARASNLTDCFLWMNHPTGPSPADLSQWDEVGNCFEALADALALVRSVLDTPENHQDVFEQALDLLAEAQSALRVAVGRIDGPTDRDQLQAFNWLKRTAAERQIFLQRHMRVDDPADPALSAELAGRLDALDSRLQEARRREKQRRKWFGKVRYEVKQLAADDRERDPHWRTLIKTVDELVVDGTPASSRELRELLLPIVEQVPDLELPPSFQAVLREIDRYLESRPAEEAQVERHPSAHVLEAARLLRGRKVVLIGGTRRPHIEAALQSALGVMLDWIETREHESLAGFEQHVARPAVELVLLAIRWSSHSYGEVKLFCDRHGKLFVRLPGGLSPNQVAAQILAQCGERLAERATQHA
jgi:hypothetical protein